MFISKKKTVFWGHTCPIFDWQNFTFWSKETRIKLLLVHDHWWGSKCLPKNIVRQAVLERLLQSKSPPSLFSRHNQDRTTEARADVCWTLASKRENWVPRARTFSTDGLQSVLADCGSKSSGCFKGAWEVFFSTFPLEWDFLCF